MEAVGQLAGGVAHDFNNLLTIIKVHAELLLDGVGPENPMHEDLQEIQKAGARAASLTRQLLAFSRKQLLQPRVLDLNAILAGLEPMLRRLISEDIRLVTRPAPELGRVSADAGQIEQVLVNLAVNARDAMPDGGTVTIETSDVELDAEFGRRRGANVPPGRYVRLAVSDTGVGMDESTRSRIFEPFFTTKEVGKGTGLGLSTVYGIVKQSNGFIWVSSRPGEGTTFEVHLPRVGEPAPEEGSAPTIPAAAGSETVLLVEDEESVRSLARRILERQGYTVLEARHGQEALRAAAEHAGTIDLAMTDVVMPEMSGSELAHRLEAMRPGVRVLYMSGYTDDEIIRRGVLGPGMAFLEKPFTANSLAKKVREVLDGG
jgi:CheY-like chemotaxis protein